MDRLFHSALKRPPEERAAFLAKACGTDEAVRQKVEALIAAHEQSGEFLDTPAFEVATSKLPLDRADSLVNRIVGHYKILGALGAGGMGEVYLAQDTRLGRKIALKVLPREFTTDADRVRRFEQEARAASALSHPNVCVIHEIGDTEDGRRFITMEYIEGTTLRQQLAHKRLTLMEALDVAIQIASGLAVAHAAGIVHRDIKPENVMLRDDGLVKVLDFGLAKLTQQTTETDTDTEALMRSMVNTGSGMIMGTVAYMSPEQARGLAVDLRTDIWSLGVLLYEMIAGRAPFVGATPSDMLVSILEREPPTIAGDTLEVPAELQRIVQMALRKDREERYRTAEDFLVDLKSLQHELAIEAEVERLKQPTPSSRSAVTAINREAITSRFSPLWLTRRRPSRVFRYALLILVPLVLAALAYALYTREKPRPAISSIMVLPLENISGNSAEEYFADGMTEALIGDLAKIGGLHVISRTSSMHYKGTKKSLPEIAREINVDAIVEGTVQRSGDRVVVRAQLIHAPTDRHLWVSTYTRDMRDVLDLQSEVAQAIAQEVRIQMTPDEQARFTSRRPVRPKAYEDYLQGRYLYWNKRTEENLNKAVALFKSAIKEDESYAAPYVGLADCYNALGTVQVGALPPLEARRNAEEAATKALQLDNGLAEAYGALGYVKHFNWDWTGAEQDHKRAIELNPNYANGHNFYASFLMSRGRIDESIAASNRARELDPFSLAISAQRGFLLEQARRYGEAIEQLRGVTVMDPTHYQAYWILGHTYAANQQFDEAIAASDKAVQLSERTPGALGILGLAYGLAGRKAEATKILNELLELNKTRYVTPAALVNVYVGLGDKEQAFVWLEKAYQERSNYIAYLKVFPLLDPLRSDPRFKQMVRKVGL
jgi:serine/threonine-protein kinase